MTYPPGQTTTLTDGKLGSIGASDILPLVVGPSSSGTGNTITTHYDAVDLVATVGYGPGPEMAAPLANRGGVLFLKCTVADTGSNSVVTAGAGNTGTGTVTVAGNPIDDYDVTIEITTTGTLGTGRWRYSLDGGRTYGGIRTLPAGGTFAVPSTGLTLTFVPGAGPIFFAANDTHTFTSTGPVATSAEITTAMTGLAAALGNRKLEQIFIAGQDSSAANAATKGSAVEAIVEGLHDDHIFTRAALSCGNDTASNVQSAIVAVVESNYLAYCFSTAAITSEIPIEGRGVPTVPFTNAVAIRAVEADISENLGRRASGPLTNVIAITHDEATTQSFLESDRITTSMTRRGNAGYYITNGFLRSGQASDYIYWDYGRTVDRAARVTWEGEDPWILSKVRVKTDGTGQIKEVDARRVEESVKRGLDIALTRPTNVEGYTGHVSGYAYEVSRTNDVLSTRTLVTQTRLVPLVPIEGIETTVGFARALEG